ncbi:homoserine dehydrogenase [Acetoanaerobium pronyense]|uniref:Homoserine dehydrogenase n=1 Tax=Acetoanaerobium pronyense TaxID=1482736 RepID=A0ABS4KIX4_9FIRM|nr:homoserine dehydrogenase [Acetoanaerobium pronyense]
MEKIQIAVLGLGTVGSGVKNILQEKKELLKERIFQKTGLEREIEIKKILIRDINKVYDVDKELLTEDFEDILNDDDIKIVVELIGGNQPATDYMIKAMKANKNVITANKLVIAKSNGLLEKVAKENDVRFMYEASVAGTVPVIKVINDSLVGNSISKISGIVNGTTNYILSKMTNENKSFEEALKSAQDLGFAESDPSSDIDGDDSLYKIAILSKLAFSTEIDLEKISKQGIRHITKTDIENAKNSNKRIKFLAQAEKKEGKVVISVSPVEIDSKHPLANVEGAMNAVCISCDNAGEIMLQGAGAGSRPTASAVVSDIFSVASKL